MTKGIKRREADRLASEASHEVREMAERLMLAAENDSRGRVYGRTVGAQWEISRFHKDLYDAKQLALAEVAALDEEAEESSDYVTVETMPDDLRGSHREARNWGRYPANGAVRLRMRREHAEAIVRQDPDGYAHILGEDS